MYPVGAIVNGVVSLCTHKFGYIKACLSTCAILTCRAYPCKDNSFLNMQVKLVNAKLKLKVHPPFTYMMQVEFMSIQISA